MQILIADDDAISRRLATHALTGCGADVAIAEDGHAAWTQIRADDAAWTEETRERELWDNTLEDSLS